MVSDDAWWECMACGRKVVLKEGVWLAERSEGNGPFLMHRVCAQGPWPLYEITANEAREMCRLQGVPFIGE